MILDRLMDNVYMAFQPTLVAAVLVLPDDFNMVLWPGNYEADLYTR